MFVYTVSVLFRFVLLTNADHSKCIYEIFVNKLINMTFIIDGRGQFFVPPYRAHCWSRGNAELCAILQCQRTWKVLPTSSPRLVLMMFWPLLCPFLCPHLYWAEYFYVANVVKVFFINLFCILLMWFCLSRHITSRHITPRHITTWQHTTSHRFSSRHISFHHITHHITSYHIISFRISHISRFIFHSFLASP